MASYYKLLSPMLAPCQVRARDPSPNPDPDPNPNPNPKPNPDPDPNPNPTPNLTLLSPCQTRWVNYADSLTGTELLGAWHRSKPRPSP